MSASTNVNDHTCENTRHEQALIRLGQLALSDRAPIELMSEVADLLTKILPVEYSKIWQLLDDRKKFLLMMGCRSGLPP